MGVADKITYRDMYYFKGDFNGVKHGDLPSVKDEPAINSTIKENPDKANVEIEGGEMVLQPDLSALYKAVGKKHSRGGMDVLLKPNSFIFSDDKGLALTEKDHDMLELKKGGNFRGNNNTPANVVKRNIDTKHYNTLVSNLSNNNKDYLAKNSSAKMLEKYIQTLGNIAYAQEAKKGFPQGLPSFSQGTAPVYDPHLKDDIMEQKQYMKYGGTAENPYLPKAQAGLLMNEMYNRYNKMRDANTARSLTRGRKDPHLTAPTSQQPSNWGLWNGDQLPIFQKRYGVSNAADKISNLDALASQLGYSGPHDNKSFQQWLYNSSPENKAVIDKWHNNFNVGPNAGMFDGKIGIRWANALNEIANRPKVTPPPLTVPNTPTVTQQDTPLDTITPNDVNGNPSKGKEINWQFTPWQKLSQAYNWGQYAGVKRYMPYRSRFNATYAEPSLLNPEQTVADLRGEAAHQIGTLSTLSPILRNAQASSAFGQLLDRTPSVRTQYDNENAQITNQFRQYNNQIRNNETGVNMQNDQNYYQQSVVARQNYDNMKQYLSNNAMNNTLRDVETNQRLAYNLMTMDNPAYGFNFKTGNFTRNPKDVRDVQGMLPQNSLQGMLDYAKQLKDSGLDPAVQSALLRGQFFKQVAPYFGQTNVPPQYPYPYKKGGRTGNPYKY